MRAAAKRMLHCPAAVAAPASLAHLLLARSSSVALTLRTVTSVHPATMPWRPPLLETSYTRHPTTINPCRHLLQGTCFTCASNCAKCSSVKTTGVAPGTKEVTINAASCKGTAETVSWMCCRGASDGENVLTCELKSGSCTGVGGALLGSGKYETDKEKCNDVQTLTCEYQLPCTLHAPRPVAGCQGARHSYCASAGPGHTSPPRSHWCEVDKRCCCTPPAVVVPDYAAELTIQLHDGRANGVLLGASGGFCLVRLPSCAGCTQVP